jgi:hypothetical protein
MRSISITWPGARRFAISSLQSGLPDSIRIVFRNRLFSYSISSASQSGVIDCLSHLQLDRVITDPVFTGFGQRLGYVPFL